MKTFTDWKHFLSENLEFPFNAVLSDWQGKTVSDKICKVTVKEIQPFGNELDGVIVVVCHRGRNFTFQLCDLDVADKSSKNYELIKAYKKSFTKLAFQSL